MFLQRSFLTSLAKKEFKKIQKTINQLNNYSKLNHFL